MNLFGKNVPTESETENPYWISFSDIMAGLLAIFILTLVTLMIQLHYQIAITKETQKKVEQALEELSRVNEIRKDLLEEIQADLLRKNIKVEIRENNSVLRIPDDQLYFKSGEYYIPKEKTTLVDEVGSVLEKALNKKERMQFIDTIFIEGHTDSRPYRKQEMGNWGLSSYRSIAIWKFWTETPGKQISFTEMKNKNGKNMFSVSGYADTRRVELDEDTASKRKRNRRIDLRFTMKTPDTGDLKKLLEEFKK
jgi:flagellar motor protein MotB